MPSDIQTQVPLPSALPGAFFVLMHDRERGCFSVAVDDEENSSFKLGYTVQAAKSVLVNLWGLPLDFAEQALDMVLEWHVPVQCIPGEGRVLALIDREASKVTCFDAPRQPNGGWLHNVR